MAEQEWKKVPFDTAKGVIEIGGAVTITAEVIKGPPSLNKLVCENRDENNIELKCTWADNALCSDLYDVSREVSAGKTLIFFVADTRHLYVEWRIKSE